MMKVAHRNSRLWIGLILAFAVLWIAPHAFAQDSTHEVELVGPIEAISGSTLTVNGLTIDVSGAEINVALAVGTEVHVEGELLDDGTVAAYEVGPVEDGVLPGEVEMHGTLASLDAATAVVSGLTFDVSGAEVEDGLAVGDLVVVHASLSDTGTWIAREISSEDETSVGDDSSGDDARDDSSDDSVDDSSSDDSQDESEDFEIVGTLDQIGDGFIVVSGQQIDTTGAEVSDTLVLGMLVKVHVSLVDGALVASEVKPTLASDDSMDDSSDDSADDSSDDSADDSGGDSADDSSSDACLFEVEANSANLRSGPGVGYDVLGFALEGDRLAVTALHTSGEWVQVEAGGGGAWISLSTGSLEHAELCAGLPVSDLTFLGSDTSVGDDSGHDGSDDSSEVDDSGDDSSDDSSEVDDSGHDSSDDSGGDSGDDSSDDSGDDSGGHGGDDAPLMG